MCVLYSMNHHYKARNRVIDLLITRFMLNLSADEVIEVFEVVYDDDGDDGDLKRSRTIVGSVILSIV